MTSALSWFSTWLIMILLLVVLAKITWGRTIVYYLLWLAVALLLYSHADELTSMFNVSALQLNG